MKTFIADTEYSETDTLNKWKGLFPDSNSFNQIISHKEDFQIVKPERNIFGEYEPFLFCIKNAYKGKDYDNIKNTLLSIEDVSKMRANCSGPIDKDKLKTDFGWVEGIDYKLRTPNSYFTKNYKSGKWNQIAVGQEINSLLLGYKRGRFTGGIGLSGWAKDNPDRWETLKKISTINERAFKKASPDTHKSQKIFCEKCIQPNHRIGIYTALSTNQFSENSITKSMSFHIDKGDTKFGFTSMCVFRVGNYKGAYLVFPRWNIGVDIEDGDIVICDSSQLHGVSPIKGNGIRLSCVAYCDDGLATIGGLGKKEKLIGIKKQKEYSFA